MLELFHVIDVIQQVGCDIIHGLQGWKMYHTPGGTRPKNRPFFVAKINVLEGLFSMFLDGVKIEKTP